MTEMPHIDFEHKLQAAFKAPDASDEFVRKTLTMIRSSSPKVSAASSSRQLKPIWVGLTLLLALIALTTLALGPSKVWAAIKGWFLPGYGTFENHETLRMQASPVTETAEDYSVRVVNVFLSAEKLTIELEINGPADDRLYSALSKAAPQLETKSKTLVRPMTIGLSYENEGALVKATLYYPPLGQVYQDELTLVFPRWADMAPALPLAEMRVNIPLKDVSSEDLVVPASIVLPPVQTHDQITMRISEIYTLGPDTFLKVEFETPSADFQPSPMWAFSNPITDAQGNPYPLSIENCEQCAANELLVKATDLPADTPLTLALPSLELEYYNPVSPWDQKAQWLFELEIDAATAPGKVWAADKRIDIGPYNLHLQKLSYSQNEAGEHVFSVEVEGNPVYRKVMICARVNQELTLSCDDGKSYRLFEPIDPSPPLVSNSVFPQKPDGTVSFILKQFILEYQTHWQFEFELPKE